MGFGDRERAGDKGKDSLGAGVHLPMESWQATGLKPASPSPSSLTLIPENCQEPQARPPVASSLKQCPGHTNLLLPRPTAPSKKAGGRDQPLGMCISHLDSVLLEKGTTFIPRK